ncbi:MAG: hypothetical protein AAGA68_03620 [Pseudomonadota bacterium]
MTREPTALEPTAPLLRRGLLSAALLAVLALSISGVLDRPAGRYAEAALARAMVTYGVARSLNGVISVVQETEVALQPAGVGVTLAPGQLLDPVNDLIERFSWVMLASGVALGIESALLRMAAWWPFDLTVGFAIALLLLGVWKPSLGAQRTRAVVQRIALTLLFTRLVVPALLLVTSGISGLFLQAEQEQATQVLMDTADEVAVLAQEVEAQAHPPTPRDESLLERLGNYVGERFASLDVGQRIERARAVLGGAAAQVVTLTASFLLETVLIPIVLLWIAWRALCWSFMPLRR